MRRLKVCFLATMYLIPLYHTMDSGSLFAPLLFMFGFFPFVDSFLSTLYLTTISSPCAPPPIPLKELIGNFGLPLVLVIANQIGAALMMMIYLSDVANHHHHRHLKPRLPVVCCRPARRPPRLRYRDLLLVHFGNAPRSRSPRPHCLPGFAAY